MKLPSLSRRRARMLIAFAAILLLTGASVGAPHALRRMDSFDVQRVEVRGTRYLPPHEALGASGITKLSSVFDDFTPWISSLEQHPLISTATITRELPGTIHITVVEAEPIALIGTPELRPVNASGELLPLDPSRVDLDLPLVIGSDTDVLIVLAALERVKLNEPAMLGWISEAEATAGGVRIGLRSPAGAEALLPALPDAQTLRELRLTLADLAARNDLTRVARVDARYRGQVVVRLTTVAAAL